MSLSLQAAIWQKASIAALKSETGMADGDLAIVEGYYTAGDRGGGTFKYVSGSSETDDGGRYVTPNGGSGRWVRLLNGETANVKMWGAVGDGNANDTVAIQKAMNACLGWTYEIFIPRGTYIVTNTIEFRGEQLHIRGESPRTIIMMPVGIQTNILQTAIASKALTGQDVSSDWEHDLLIENLTLMFEYGTDSTRNTNNACLVLVSPGETHTIRNVKTFNGRYGIRCFGSGAPGLRLRDVSPFDAAVAGICVEPLPGIGWHQNVLSFMGISGDHRWDSSRSNACLILLSNFVGNVSIQDVKAEGLFGGGIIHITSPDASVGFGVNAIGSATIRNVNCNLGVTVNTNDAPRDLVVLRGGQRGAALLFEMMSLWGIKNLVRDEVTGRTVNADVNVLSGFAQSTARVPISYESFKYSGSTNTIDDSRSRLVVGNAAIYKFAPPTNGWYRIMNGVNGGAHVAGKLTVSALKRRSCAFDVDVKKFGSASSTVFLNVTRTAYDSSADGARPLVTKARAFQYWDVPLDKPRAFVDIFVERLGTASYVQGNYVIVAMDINGVEGIDSGEVHLLTPTQPVSDTLPSGAVSSGEVSLVRN